MAPLSVLYCYENEDVLRLTHETTRVFITGNPSSLQILTNALESARRLASEITAPHQDEHQILQVIGKLEAEFKSTMTTGLTFRVIGHEVVRKGNFVLYHIEVVKRGEQKYVIKQRFSDILSDLHNAFGKQYGLDAPRKHKIEALVNGTDEKFIEKRKKELQDYFAVLLSHMGGTDMKDEKFTTFFHLPEGSQT